MAAQVMQFRTVLGQPGEMALAVKAISVALADLLAADSAVCRASGAASKDLDEEIRPVLRDVQFARRAVETCLDRMLDIEKRCAADLDEPTPQG